MEVDTGQLVVVASLADEQDDATVFDLDDGSVAEFHQPANPRVELRERRSSPSHMVCCPCVEDALPVLMLLTPKNADLALVIWFVVPDGVNITHAEAIWILGTFRTSIINN